jgi:hypothetical protein
MKHCLFALSAALLLTSCAGVKIVDTQVASGAANPTAIYIRPFDASTAVFKGRHRGGTAEQPIRQSLAGREFAQALKVELEKLAPARILEDDEVPTEGWLVEGSLDVVHAGSPTLRHVFHRVPVGKSEVQIHVRVSEVGSGYSHRDKDGSVLGRRGRVIYEFDLAGGSRASGKAGSVYAPGLGYATPFDFRNAAERVMMALSTDPHRYGVRDTPTIRY